MDTQNLRNLINTKDIASYKTQQTQKISRQKEHVQGTQQAHRTQKTQGMQLTHADKVGLHKDYCGWRKLIEIATTNTQN